MFKAIDRFVDRLLLKLYDATEFIDTFLKMLGNLGSKTDTQ